jgi:hypothetical protein
MLLISTQTLMALKTDCAHTVQQIRAFTIQNIERALMEVHSMVSIISKREFHSSLTPRL